MLLDTSVEGIAAALERPDSFANFGDDRMFVTWSLGPVILTRDASILERSNADEWVGILTMAEKQGDIEPDSWKIVHCSHWACGWVDHLSFQVIDNEESRQPTRVFKLVCDTLASLRKYPVLNDQDYSGKEYEAALDSIRSNAPRRNADAPKDWAEQVFSWLWDGPSEHQDCLSEREGGVWVPEEYIVEALQELGWLEVEEE